MLKRLKNRLICFFTHHNFYRFPLLGNDIQIMCSRCFKCIIVQRKIEPTDDDDNIFE